MFDFEKLTVYTKAKSFNLEVGKLLKQINTDAATKNLHRALSPDKAPATMQQKFQSIFKMQNYCSKAKDLYKLYSIPKVILKSKKKIQFPINKIPKLFPPTNLISFVSKIHWNNRCILPRGWCPTRHCFYETQKQVSRSRKSVLGNL